MSRNRNIPFKRKRQGKTNYRSRLELLKSRKTRLVIRFSLKYIYGQIVEYKPEGDRVVVSASSKELKNFGWNFEAKNMPSSYLLGYLLGVKAKKEKIGEVILDIKRAIPKSRVYSAVKGVIDSGVKIPCSDEVLPDDSRIKGNHIAEFSQKATENQFSKHDKDKLKNINKMFDDTRNKIKG